MNKPGDVSSVRSRASLQGKTQPMSKITRLDQARRAYVLGTIKESSLPGDCTSRARHCRLRAEELRIIAEEVLLRETSRTLISLAGSFEQMAEIADNGFAGSSDDGSAAAGGV